MTSGAARCPSRSRSPYRLGPAVQRHLEVQHRRHEVHSLDQPGQVGTLERADLHKQVVAAFSNPSSLDAI